MGVVATGPDPAESGETQVFHGSPTPKPGYQRPPVHIHLQANRESVAANLHQAYGDFVALEVGALHYPDRTRVSPWPVIDADQTTADPAQLHIEPEQPLIVPTGLSACLALSLTNRTESTVSVQTNGNVTAVIVDSAGDGVGGQAAPLITVDAQPGETVRIPLLIGTDSYSPELGYAVPAGQWHVVAPFDLDDGGALVSPPLPRS